MRLIDADELIKEFLNVCRTEFEIKNKCLADENVLFIIQNAPTVEFPEQITIKCDTEEDKQKLLSALRNANLQVFIEEERPQGEWIKGREISRTMIGDNMLSIDYKDYTCSRCGLVLDRLLYHVDGSPFCKFCPECGADMRGGKSG